MKIKYKLFIINVIVILIAVILIIFFIFSFSKKSLDDNLKVRAELYKNNISNLIEIEKQGLILHVRDYSFWEEMGIKGVINKDREWIEENLDPWVRDNFGYKLIYLVTTDVNVIVDTPSLNINPQDFILKDKEIKSGIKIINGLPFIYATSPVFDSYGERFFNAYLTFGIQIDGVLLNKWKNLLDMDIALITKDIYITTNEKLKRYEFMEIKPPYQYVDNYIRTFLPIYDDDGEKIADIHIHKFDDIPSKIIKTIYSGIFVGAISTILSALIINIILITNILKPLEKLEMAVREVSKGNYNVKIDFVRDDEIGYLAKSFSSMIDKIMSREKIILSEKERAVEMTYKDPLTDIFNRKYLIEKIENLIKNKEPFSIVF